VKTKALQEENISKNGIDFESKFNSKIGEGQSVLQARFERNRKDLERSGDKVLEELAKKYDDVTSRMEGASHDGRVEVRKTGQDAIIRLTQTADTNTFVQKQEEKFIDTLDGLGKLLNGLYETRLNNLVAQSRTEITSAAKHAEECLAVTKAELQTDLNAFQRDYKAKYEALFAKLEKTVEEYSKKQENGTLRGLKEERAKDHLNALFRRIGQEMVESAALTARNMEADFQRSMDEFEKRIDNAKTQACDSLERESRLMHKEMSRNFQDFSKQVSDLKSQVAVLERKGKEAAHLVMTLKQADLDL
jgi:translation initiation factor 2 alpha subunit (eIF-2alpha)